MLILGVYFWLMLDATERDQRVGRLLLQNQREPVLQCIIFLRTLSCNEVCLLCLE